MTRFELETITDVSWELPQGLFEYVDKYMTHHVSKRVLKGTVLASPRRHNMKETPVLDEYFIKFLL